MPKNIQAFFLAVFLCLTTLPYLSLGQGSVQTVLLEPNPAAVSQSIIVVNSSATPSLQAKLVAVPVFYLDGPVVLDYIVQHPEGNFVSNAEVNWVKATFRATSGEPIKVAFKSNGESSFSANLTISGAAVEFSGGTLNTDGTGSFEFNPQFVVVSATSVRGFYLSKPFQLVNVNASLPTLPARIAGRFSSGPNGRDLFLSATANDTNTVENIVKSFITNYGPLNGLTGTTEVSISLSFNAGGAPIVEGVAPSPFAMPPIYYEAPSHAPAPGPSPENA